MPNRVNTMTFYCFLEVVTCPLVIPPHTWHPDYVFFLDIYLLKYDKTCMCGARFAHLITLYYTI